VLEREKCGRNLESAYNIVILILSKSVHRTFDEVTSSGMEFRNKRQEFGNL